jgi:hypothetical protein
MQSATATVHTVSSVKVAPSPNSRKSLVLIGLNSWIEPMMSPAIAPSMLYSRFQAPCPARLATMRRLPTSLKAMPPRIIASAKMTVGGGRSPRNSMPIRSAQTGIR